MLSGHAPFHRFDGSLGGASAVKIIERIKKGDVTFPDCKWGQVSMTAKDLIKGKQKHTHSRYTYKAVDAIGLWWSEDKLNLWGR